MTEPDDITIRAASADDVPRILELTEPFVADRRLLPRSEEEVAHLARHGFLAESAGRLAGFAGLEIYSRKLAEIQCLAVSADFQGRGIAKQLIARCVARARELNVLEIMAITSSDDLFRACGFHYALPDEKRAFFFHPGEDEPAS